MTTMHRKILVALAAASLLGSPVYAGPGGNGNGNGNGGSNGNGGNSADAGSASAGAQSHGHGQETSAAATDPATRGLEKALSVVSTTPASPQATLSIQAAIDAFLGRSGEDESSEAVE